jgi:hypothetical protein
MVLGRTGEAENALERALVAFEGEAEASKQLREAAIEAGLTPEGQVQ